MPLSAERVVGPEMEAIVPVRKEDLRELFAAAERVQQWVAKGIADHAFDRCVAPGQAVRDLASLDEATAAIKTQTEANAVLMSAAPDLLIAAKAIAEGIVESLRGHGLEPNENTLDESERALLAAIAKAEGRS